MKPLVMGAAVFTLLILAAQPAPASDQLVVMMGQGGLMASPAGYSGSFLSGFTGSWEFKMEDSLWPSASDTTARFNYIWETFFADNYDASSGSEAWYGTFNAGTLPREPGFTLDLSSPLGDVAGSISIVVMVRDDVPDGLLSQSEKHGNCNLTATLVIHPGAGSDEFDNMCGTAAVGSGDLNFVNAPGVDMVFVNGLFSTYPCPSPVEGSSWGCIKALYE
jgi:hypothetical protein